MNPQLVQAEHAWIALALTGAGIGIAWVLYTAFELVRYHIRRWRVRKELHAVVSQQCSAPLVGMARHLQSPPMATAVPRVGLTDSETSGYLGTHLRRVK